MIKRRYSLLRSPRTSLRSIFSKKERRSRFEEIAGRIPFEILENIFLQAARDPSLRSLSVSLIRVSRWVHDLVLPYLYQSIQLRESYQAESFLYTITHNHDVCRFITNFEAREIKNPDVTYRPAKIPLWLRSCGVDSPNFHTLARIFRILLESTVEQADQTHNSFRPPLASGLKSVIIHSLYLTPPYWTTLGNTFKGVNSLVLPSLVAVTSMATIMIECGTWDFTHVRKLRFTSLWMSAQEYIYNRVFFPHLTHLSLGLEVDVVNSLNFLLTNPRIQKLVVFIPFVPKNTTVPRRFQNVSSPSNIPEIRGDISTFGAPNVLGDTNGLETMTDGRLFLFNTAEMERAYGLSNEAFWDAIERL